MAANRFATMLHRKTNKIIVILIYAVLEWVLILLLFSSSLFSYFIIKFAEIFGLKPPCPWCTRIDHIIDPVNGNKNIHRDLLCEAHAMEVSSLGFCSIHRKLVESQDTCENCLLSMMEFDGLAKKFAGFSSVTDSWVTQKDEAVGEKGEVSLKCSCCRVNLVCDKSSYYTLLKTSSFDDLEYPQKENLITEAEDYKFANHVVNVKPSDFLVDVSEIMLKKENSAMIMKDESVQVCEEDVFIEISHHHLEYFLDYSTQRLIRVEPIDSMAEEQKTEENVTIECYNTGENQECMPESGVSVSLLDVDKNELPKYAVLDSIEIKEDEKSLEVHVKDCLLDQELDNLRNFPLDQSPFVEESDAQELSGGEKEKHSDVCTGLHHLNVGNAVCEEVADENHENEADVSIGTEIPDVDLTDEIQTKGCIHSEECTFEDYITASNPIHEVETLGTEQDEEPMLQLRNSSAISNPSFHLEPNEIEDDKIPDTPTSVDSFRQFHQKKLHFLEKRCSVTEESLDGSVTSDLECVDGVISVESLKSSLKAERRALKALYAELEEERSASAVAASQTMAMINRLHEEKAAVQMEALQYQRMMEEQSEYDQEAVQLLNELMVKREKENQELERELEGCRKKLLDYEMKEKARMSKNSNKNGSPSSSCSNSEDSDEAASYAQQEHGEENTPTADLASLNESLADFEEERLSILEQLKVLEEKLVTLDDDKEQQHFQGVNGETNGHTDGVLDDTINGKHRKQTIASGPKGKPLPPLSDAIGEYNGDEAMDATGNGFETNGVSYSGERESQTMGNAELEEEVYHLYERLQALETDREFLKHCFSSLRKGEKGIHLLQEIVHHLRDLKNVELRARNSNDSII